jgi:membrane-associated phospholipid phosphatase
MIKTKNVLTQSMGLAGTIACIGLFIYSPSFPTPDKLLVFLVFVFMIFGEAWVMFKRLFPFVAVILIYESFRSFADKLNTHVNYSLAPHFDHIVFGNLPTIYFQNWLWKGHPSWYDYVIYLPYLLHFILPICLAILVWKTRLNMYWRVVSTYLVVAFAAFLTYFIFPAAPPWLASQKHYIAHVARISSDVWAGLGLQDFPSAYNHITPNPVAAIPSLHAAWATLLVIFVFKLYGRRWGLLAGLYPAIIYFGTIYQAEHYAFDVILGILYGIGGYLATPYLMKQTRRLSRQIKWLNKA